MGGGIEKEAGKQKTNTTPSHGMWQTHYTRVQTMNSEFELYTFGYVFNRWQFL